MDTSKEYILMCEKAVEIQELWKKQAGDIFAQGYPRGNTLIVGFHCTFSEVDEHYPDRVWLPRQDQLQEMVENNISDFLEFCFAPNSCCGCSRTVSTFIKIKFKNLSMEQLWLAFVMKEKFNKVWNGTDWIKNDNT